MVSCQPKFTIMYVYAIYSIMLQVSASRQRLPSWNYDPGQQTIPTSAGQSASESQGMMTPPCWAKAIWVPVAAASTRRAAMHLMESIWIWVLEKELAEENTRGTIFSYISTVGTA